MYPPLAKYGISSGYRTAGRPDHRGIDIPCPIGTPLPSPIDGVIAFEGYIAAAAPGYGKEIICIIQGNNEFVVMGHLSRTVVNTGQRVKVGDLVAHSGNTGYVLPKPTAANPSAGQHLHIELCIGTKDPTKGLLAYPTKDITPLLKNYGQAQGGANDVTRDQLFDNCFITVAQRWPSNEERNAWRSSGLEPYTWVQRHAPNTLFNHHQALEIYQAAREKVGSKYPGGPAQFATDRIQGGDNFHSVMERDMAFYVSRSLLAEELLSREVPEPLTDDDKKNMTLGRKLRELLKEAA